MLLVRTVSGIDLYKDIFFFFITVDNDNTAMSITLVVIRHALLVVMVAKMEKMMDFYSLNLDYFPIVV